VISVCGEMSCYVAYKIISGCLNGIIAGDRVCGEVCVVLHV
jgi:hypothetical protein